MKQKIKNALLGMLATCVFVGSLSLAPDDSEARARVAKSGATWWSAMWAKQGQPPKKATRNAGWRNSGTKVATTVKAGRTGKAAPTPVRVAGTAQGSASWYGPGFHGRSTASGEKFDQNALTAAHPSLPFGTRVRVTNRNNGKSVVLRINDRGPFSGGRIIDLSKGAASAIGMVATGTAPVSLQVL